ncbi:hypothetical protein [Phytomonospora endophytica]|uniref:Uncharacterized protein n=1 Tax=Phytomonospora endophytica TaxID=714109 RepID=A0A841F693_9ACTN|nr:hypothetical protein [Phytomonospora endophytica]MBB6032451.1 hypothetical protein [Phytomonospora endophytica]GIG66402.1 hypothetical protein Pen01_26970 [Phytomonospora endophytica]
MDEIYAIGIQGAVGEPAPARIFSVRDQEIGDTVVELGPLAGDLSNAFDPSTGDHWWIAGDEVSSQRGGVHAALSVPKGKRGLAFRRDGRGFFFAAEAPGRVLSFEGANPGGVTPVEVHGVETPVDLAFDGAGRALLLTADGVLAEVDDTSGPKWTVSRTWSINAAGHVFTGLALAESYVTVAGRDTDGSFITEVVFDNGSAGLEPPFDLGSIGKVGDLASAHFPDGVTPGR